MAVKVREKVKGSGECWIFIDFRGRRRSKKVGSKANALKAAKKIEARLTLGDFGIVTKKKAAPTFKEMAERWLEIHVKATKRKSTYDRYRSLMKNYLIPALGPVPINEVKRSDVIRTLRIMQAKKMARSSIELARNAISGVVEFAIDEELIHENPTQGVMKRLGCPRRSQREAVSVFTQVDINLILATFLKHRSDYYHLILTAFRTGMRLGEVLGLEWGDINWRSRYIMVQRSFRNNRMTLTKNSRPRRVDMSDQLHFELRRLFKLRKEEALKAGSNEPHEIVFHTHGKPTSQNTVRNIWRRMLGKAGLEYRKFHTIRHTFASILISIGESLAYIKELMGHSSIQITVDIYGHLLPTENHNALNVLDAPIRTLSAPSQNKKAATH